MVTRVFLPLILIVGALVVVGIVLPTLNGPFRVDCGQLDEQTCQQAWREVAIHEEGLTSLLPVTRVRVTATDPGDPESCTTIYIERWIFSTTVKNNCEE
jgi:hypothetical protein